MPSPQPNFVPVSPSSSRNTQRSGVSDSELALTELPFTISFVAMTEWYGGRMLKKVTDANHPRCTSPPRLRADAGLARNDARRKDRSEEHTSELQSRGLISYAVFCLKKK